jgi:hypothetical protein
VKSRMYEKETQKAKVKRTRKIFFFFVCDIDFQKKELELYFALKKKFDACRCDASPNFETGLRSFGVLRRWEKESPVWGARFAKSRGS